MAQTSTLAQQHMLAQNSRIHLHLNDIGKSFSGVSVLRGVTLDITGGEIHTLMGENGAGKSTLVKIISGVQGPSTGTLSIDGEEVSFATPGEANDAGIVIMHQELSLIPDMTVAQNVMLGQEPRRGGLFVDSKALRETAQAALQKFGFMLDVDTLVKDLRVGEQQLVEIARALLMDARLLIMDEPTSALSQTEADILMEVVRDLAQQGVAVVYISHRMDEVFEISDRVTVLRDGDLIGTTLAADTTPEDLIKMMVGRSVEIKPVTRKQPASDETVMAVRDLSARAGGRDVLRDISFDLKRGEVLGIGGLLGAGRTELLETLFGARGGSYRGEIEINGASVDMRTPADGVANGLALITEDRKGNGLLLDRTIAENVVLPLLPLKARFGYFSASDRDAEAQQVIDRLKVAATGVAHPVGRLSGGNQQKVVLGKWLATQPSILLLDEPTRGIDIGAKDEIYDLIGELADQGLSVLFASSEIPEFMAVCDRMIVLCDGAVAGELTREDMSVTAILISPKESAGLTGVVEQATDAGIPVFVLDRNVDTDKFVQWVGGDNDLIGREAGKFALDQLGGAGAASGTIVEIWGGLGTQAAHDRANGFHEAFEGEDGVTFLLDQQSGDWKQDQAYDIMSTALRNFEDITMVYGHNDPMAYGAYLAAKDAGRADDIIFIGVDALPGEGVTWVANGELSATCLYPTPGAEGLRQALAYLGGSEVEKSVVMGTEAVTSVNADAILERNGLK